jgi:excisionase family DNA binding protein
LRVLTTEDYDRMVDRMDAPMLTPAQAAEQLGISRQAVHKLITTQNLAARRVGARWLVPADAVAHRLETVQSR